MRNLKKFLALVLAFMMAFSLMATAQADYVEDYDDREEVSARYGAAVDFLNGLGVFQGVENENGGFDFQPARLITRAEVTALVYRIMTGDVENKQVSIYENYPAEFRDVAGSANDWAAGYINYCANGLYVRGYGNNIFRPDRNITGYQLLAIVLRCLGYGENGEFEGTGWETRTATTAQRLGITKNVTEPLSAEATREEVAEILYRAMQTDTVTYGYTYDKNVLVEDNYNNRLVYNARGYDLPICETLLYRNFQIVGCQIAAVRDKYGRPSIMWVKDGANDTIASGTKYVAAGTYTEAFTLTVKPVMEFYDAVDECDLVHELAGDGEITVDAEYLNGRRVEARTDPLDALHTTDHYIGAQGRKTEIYTYTDAVGADRWDIVYIDTYMGVVREIIPVTLDTAGHVMKEAELHIEVGGYDSTNGYAVLTQKTNFEDYSVGDKLLLNTYSPSWWNSKVSVVSADKGGGNANRNLYIDWSSLDALTVDRLNSKASAVPTHAFDVAGIKVTVNVALKTDPSTLTPAKDDFNFGTYNGAAGGWTLANNGDGTYQLVWKVSSNAVATTYNSHDFDENGFEIVGKATENTVTLTGTTGAAEDKNGVITSEGTFPANVVFHMNNHNKTADASALNNGVRTTVDGLDHQITNEDIGKSFILYLDDNGNILGMEPVVKAGVGVVLSVDAVRVGAGKYALEAEIYMEDGNVLTARFLKDGDSTDLHKYWDTTEYNNGDVVDNYADGTEVLRYNNGVYEQNFGPDALVKISPYIKDGQTYYQVDDGDHENYDGDNGVVATPVSNAASENNLLTGVANTLDGCNDGTEYIVDDDTIFFIAYNDFQYNWGTGNAGASSGAAYQVFHGFKTIPTITGTGSPTGDERDNVHYQTLGKYVAVTGLDLTSDYDVSAKRTQSVDDSYLVISLGTTYAEYAEYEVMHNGVKETVKVANNNGSVNTDMENARQSGQLLVVTGWSLKGYITGVANATDNTPIAAEDTVTYKASVLTVIDHTDSSYRYLTLADGAKVLIVNRDNGTVTEGTTASIMQYEKYVDSNGTESHAFSYELDANGYVSVLYILD